jgi:RND family efflux transporter MFP subunit
LWAAAVLPPSSRNRFLPAALALIVLLAAGCSREAARSEDIRPVRAITVSPTAVSADAELPGEVRPRVESRVGFQVGGRISSRRVEIGQRVKAGDVLATLDPADFRLSAAAAAAQLNAAQIDRDQQRADIKRFEDLHRKGFISGAELERRRAQLDAAEARYVQAAALSDVSGNQTAHTVLRAPAAGVVSAIDAEVGQVVASGQSVLRIALAGDKDVAIAIPEARLEQLRHIEDVRVALWAHSAELKGRIREIAPIADPATRTFAARVTLIDAPADVALGMTATVRFAAAPVTPVLAVPLTALLREGDATYVWRLDRKTMTVSKSQVTIAGVSGNTVILGSGVQAGETIVTAGVHLLQPGQKVRLLDADPGQRAEPPAEAGK